MKLTLVYNSQYTLVISFQWTVFSEADSWGQAAPSPTGTPYVQMAVPISAGAILRSLHALIGVLSMSPTALTVSGSRAGGGHNVRGRDHDHFGDDHHFSGRGDDHTE